MERVVGGHRMSANVRPGSKAAVLGYLRERSCGCCGQALDWVEADDLEQTDEVSFRSAPPAPKCYELTCPRCGALLRVAERLGLVSPLLLLSDVPGPSVVARSGGSAG
jgi:hypothetical protein